MLQASLHMEGSDDSACESYVAGFPSHGRQWKQRLWVICCRLPFTWKACSNGSACSLYVAGFLLTWKAVTATFVTHMLPVSLHMKGSDGNACDSCVAGFPLHGRQWRQRLWLICCRLPFTWKAVTATLVTHVLQACLHMEGSDGNACDSYVAGFPSHGRQWRQRLWLICCRLPFTWKAVTATLAPHMLQASLHMEGSDGNACESYVAGFPSHGRQNLREWQKRQQLLIQFTNIVTRRCCLWKSRTYSKNCQAFSSAGNGYNCAHTYARMQTFCVTAITYHVINAAFAFIIITYRCCLQSL